MIQRKTYVESDCWGNFPKSLRKAGKKVELQTVSETLDGMLIDSHCHLKRAFEKDGGAEWFAEADRLGVSRFITVGTGQDDWDFYYRLAGQFPGKVDWTVGIHPCSVEADWEDSFKTIASYFATDPLPVALGEIGLDYFHLPKFPDEALEVKRLQKLAFRAQLGLAYQLDCPIIIHSRQAFDDSVAMIDESGVDWNKVVFHCFSEGPEQVEILNQRGGRASFTGILTYKSKSVNPIREAALHQGLDRLMLETDAPYLTPEPKRGEPNQPGYTRYIAEYAASLFGVSLETLSAKTSANTRSFFGISE